MISPHSIVWPSAEQGAACNWKFNDRLLEFCTILARLHLVSLIFSLPREVTVWSSEALKPLPRVPNRSKWPWCWDILIFETSGTSTSFGKCQWFYKCTIYIDEIWVESTTRYLWKHGYTLQQPPKHPKTIKNHPQAPQTHPLFPRNSVDYSQALMKHSERHSSCQGMSEKTLGGGNRSEGACWVSEMSVIV